MARQFTARESGENVTRWLAQEEDLVADYLVWSCGNLTLRRIGVLMVLDMTGTDVYPAGTFIGASNAPYSSTLEGAQIVGHDYINNLDNVPIPAGYRPNFACGQIGWQHGNEVTLEDGTVCQNLHTVVVLTDGTVHLYASHAAAVCNNYRFVSPLYWFVNEDGGLWGQDLDVNGAHWGTHNLMGKRVFLASLFGQSTVQDTTALGGAINGLYYKVWGNICIAYQYSGFTPTYTLYAGTTWNGKHGLPIPLHDLTWVIQYHGNFLNQGSPVVRNIYRDGTFREYNGGGDKTYANGAGNNGQGCLIYLTYTDAQTGGSESLTDVHGVTDNVATNDPFYFRSSQGSGEEYQMYDMFFSGDPNAVGLLVTNQGGVSSFPETAWNDDGGTFLGTLLYPPVRFTAPLFVTYNQWNVSSLWGAYVSSVNIDPIGSAVPGRMRGYDHGAYQGSHTNVEVNMGLMQPALRHLTTEEVEDGTADV
jgi:hypothetical protein